MMSMIMVINRMSYKDIRNNYKNKGIDLKL
jgi:hypothetical protein